MIEVKVYPDNINSDHISQIYTGLYDLEAQGKIKLKHTSKFSHELRNSIPYVTLWLNVIAPSKARRILQGESPCREEISNDFL